MSTLDMIFDGAIASGVATVFSNPFDVMLTRTQLQGEMMRRGEYQVLYKNMFQGIYRVAMDEGPRALQRGLLSAICWQITQNGIRIGSYPVVKAELEHAFGGGSFWVTVLASGVCGVIGAFTASPFVLVKVRLQSQNSVASTQHISKASTGEQYDYKGVTDALIKIRRQDGIRGLWQGVTVACQRTMIGSVTQLTTYDYAKLYACRATGLGAGDLRVHVFAALTASLCAVLFMTPLNVIMTRCYNEPKGQPSVYSKNLVLSTWRVYRVEGAAGLYKGALPLFARLGPHTILTFVFLEQICKLREKYTSRSYTSGSIVNSNIRLGQPFSKTTST